MLILYFFIFYKAKTLCIPGYGYCQVCATTFQCQTCDPGYGLLSSGSCFICMLSNCGDCGPDHTICNQCISKMGFQGGVCANCTDTNCDNCSTNINVCSQCLTGIPYNGLYAGNGTCTACFDPNCQWCTNNASTC